MNKTIRFLLSALLATMIAGHADAASRLKDLTDVEGVRENQLIGYGLVVGLNNTGDSLNNSPFTKQSLQAMLERLGVNIRGARSAFCARLCLRPPEAPKVNRGRPHHESRRQTKTWPLRLSCRA